MPQRHGVSRTARQSGSTIFWNASSSQQQDPMYVIKRNVTIPTTPEFEDIGASGEWRIHRNVVAP